MYIVIHVGLYVHVWIICTCTCMYRYMGHTCTCTCTCKVTVQAHKFVLNYKPIARDVLYTCVHV